jgi:trans-aconitate methyltransferase
MPHEFDGERYQKASTHQKEWGNKIIGEFQIAGREHILDLGCGDGVLAAQLADLVPQGRVLGIDASEGMINTARKIQKANLSFLVKDINSLDIAQEFDLVFSNATLHWVKDHSSLLKNTLAALKPGGLLRVNFAGDGNCTNFFKVVRKAVQQPEYVSYFQGFEWPWYMPSVAEYEALAKEFPFQQVRVWGENADRYFPDAAAITGWIDQPSLVPFLECIDGPDKQGFRDLVVKEMLAATCQPDGRYFETFRRINIAGRKAARG